MTDAARKAAALRPVYQQDGDGLCLQACLATLLGEPLAAMPKYDGNAKGHEVEFLAQRQQINRWLERERGMTLVLLDGGFKDLDQCSDPRALVIASGPSPRLKRSGHACLVNLQGEVVHDPHPSGAGFAGKEPYELEVLTPLAPLSLAPHFAALEARVAELERLMSRQHAALAAYIHEFGGIHCGGCPEDDTCTCSVNAEVDAVMQAVEKRWKAAAIAYRAEGSGG